MAKTQDNSQALGRKDCNRVFKPVSNFSRRLRSHDRPVPSEQESCDDGETPENEFITKP